MEKLKKSFEEILELEARLNGKKSDMIDRTNTMLKKVFGKFLWVEETYVSEPIGMFLMSEEIAHNEKRVILLPSGESITAFNVEYEGNEDDDYVDISEIIFDFFDSYDVNIVRDVTAKVSREDAEKISANLLSTLAKIKEEK